MISSDVSRWIQQSLVIYFTTKFDPTYLQIEGRKLPDPDPIPRFELKINGPNFFEWNGCWIIDVSLGVLVISIRSDRDAYSHDRLIGKCSASMATIIDVFKYGTSETDNPETYVESFVRKPGTSIAITKFTLAEPTSNLLFSLVESEYRMLLKK